MDQEKAVCQYCGKTFLNKNLKKHTKRVHDVDTSVKKSQIYCVFCNEKFITRIKLIVHLQNIHNHLTEKDSLQFKCKKDFEEWLATEDVTGQYVKRWGDKKRKNGVVGTYLCCQDGNRQHMKGQRKRALKSQGYRQTGITCTSHIVVRDIKLPQPRILVQYFKTHVGHQRQLKRPREKNKSIFESHQRSEKPGLRLLAPSERSVVPNGHAVLNEESKYIYLVVQEKDAACCDPRLQCRYCKVCRHTFSCSCHYFFLDEAAICKHIHFVVKNCNITIKPYEPIDDDTTSYKILSKSCIQIKKGISARQKVETLIGSISESLDKLETLPYDINSQIIHYLKAANVLIKSSPEQPVVPTGRTRSVAGKRRKITKQLLFQKRVRDIQKKKKNLKLKNKTNVLFTPGKNDLILHQPVPWLDVSVDHEEVIELSPT